MKRTALITGASKGIGAAIAERFRSSGIEVITPSHHQLDLSSNSSVDSFLSGFKDRIDILVNNAGINPIADIVDLKDENIDETLQVNLVSPLRLIKAFAPGMVQQNFGRIVNISSIWSVVSKPGRVAYSASKSGLNAVTRNAAVEFSKYNVLVNSIAPGFINTDLTRKNNSEEQIQQIKKLIPMDRLGEVEEIAELALFLCSEKNTYITGQTIVMDGGYSCL